MDKNVKEKVMELSGINTSKCMKCGKCSATCPAFDEMDIKPHMFVSYVEKGNVKALSESNGIYRCLSCFACVERCPRGVEPGKVIDAVRQMIIREKGMDYFKADEVPALADEDTPQQLLVSAFRRFRR